MESRRLEDSKNVKTSQAYFFEGFISFFEDFSLTIIVFRLLSNHSRACHIENQEELLITLLENVRRAVFVTN